MQTDDSKSALFADTVSVRAHGARGDGVTDDFNAIQSVLDSGARHVLIPAGTYVIGNVLQPRPGQCLELDGTLKIADAVIQPLQRDMAAGADTVEVADGSRYRPGQWVTLHDEQLPIQGGGRKTRRQNAGNARIVDIKGNILRLDAASARTYACGRNAVLATQHAAIMVNHPGVCIRGIGGVDGNKARQLDTAPCRLDEERGEDWRVASGVVVCPPGDGTCALSTQVDARHRWLERIVIEGITVCDTVLHGIAMRGVRHGIIRNTICLRAHDKNITLSRCCECSLVGNLAGASEFEDGIIFHQTPDPAAANCRIWVRGNICFDNPRNGITIGANMHEIFLADNLCVNNGINLHINADNCVSSNDVAIGCNDSLFPLEARRANVSIAGRTVRVSNLTALGSPSAALSIHGTDVSIDGGLIGDLDPGHAPGDGVGLELAPGKRASRQPTMVPDNVSVSGLTIRNCRQALALHPATGRVILRDNVFTGNQSIGDIPDEVWPRLRLRDNQGLVAHNRGLACVTAAATRVSVAHGLCRPPDIAAISLTPAGNPGAAGRFWLENVDGESFDIVVDYPPGNDGAVFAWQADVCDHTGDG